MVTQYFLIFCYDGYAEYSCGGNNDAIGGITMKFTRQLAGFNCNFRRQLENT